MERTSASPFPTLVEFLHDTTAIRVTVLYKAVDLVFIWLGFLILFTFLRHWFTTSESLLACLYLAAILPLTFAYYYFHPWDRPSLAAWMLAVWAVRDRRFWAFFLITVVAMFIKWDAIVLPALFLLANSSRQNAHKVLLQSVAAGAASLAIYVALRVLIPGGFEPYDLFAQMQRNLGQIAAGPFSYAPFLAFGLPVLFAIIGYQDSDRFMRACVWFAGLITIPMFILTNFEEVRAEMMLLPLLAPAALLGIRRFGVRGAA